MVRARVPVTQAAPPCQSICSFGGEEGRAGPAGWSARQFSGCAGRRGVWAMSLVFNSEVDLVAVGKSFDFGSRQSTQRFSQLAGALLKVAVAWPTRQPVA